MSLEMLEKGKRAVVARIDGGQCAREKLLELGVVPGVPVRVLMSAHRGPMLIEVLGSRVMIGQGLASKVIVA